MTKNGRQQIYLTLSLFDVGTAVAVKSSFINDQ